MTVYILVMTALLSNGQVVGGAVGSYDELLECVQRGVELVEPFKAHIEEQSGLDVVKVVKTCTTHHYEE